MGRVLRTSLPNGFFHVSSRGVAGRGHVFRDDDDRETFLVLVADSVERYDWICHALCLMSTHYHLVLESHLEALSAGLQRLNGGYARRFNSKYGLFGHVFADRFSAQVIESEDHLHAACAYVVENPVCAGVCDRDDEWPWSFSRSKVGAALQARTARQSSAG